MIKIAYIITSLDIGGAELMLLKLLEIIDRTIFLPIVICLRGDGVLENKIRELNIPLYSLKMKPGTFSIKAFFNLVNLLKDLSPDIIQSWMYHADFYASLASIIYKKAPLIWGIRNGNLEISKIKFSTRILIKILALFSGFFPKYIICCSEKAKRNHIQIGFKSKNFITISNGFNTSLFKPNSEARLVFNKEHQISDDTILIGHFARFSPAKDHDNFIKAALILLKEFKNIKFVLCGSEINNNNNHLKFLITPPIFQNAFLLLGQRDDIHRVAASMDIFVLSSFAEAFPNVLGEAMSCEVPCVTTNVGDAELIVGNTGVIVPPKNPHELANGIRNLILIGTTKRKELGKLARQRIEENFKLTKTIDIYQQIYKKALGLN